ncbi:MAG: hypothetical protein PHY02_04540 [Phycisphaerae bacterium]|nr:hypothetical protein [Phycisphaerae bacterium]
MLPKLTEASAIAKASADKLSFCHEDPKTQRILLDRITGLRWIFLATKSPKHEEKLVVD